MNTLLPTNNGFAHAYGYCFQPAFTLHFGRENDFIRVKTQARTCFPIASEMIKELGWTRV